MNLMVSCVDRQRLKNFAVAGEGLRARGKPVAAASTRDARLVATRIYAHWPGNFSNLLKMGRRDGKLLDSVFCQVAKKNKDGKER
jgi:hypothetical protein